MELRSVTILLMKVWLVFACVSFAVAQPYAPELLNELKWRSIGPYRGGRTVAATGVPGQPNLYYMAANNGGVWKSTDYGHVWRPIFDAQPTQSIGAIAVAPSNPNIIYVGSGEGLQRPDLSVGDGVYKSLDGGRTWLHMGLRDAQQIASILVDPGDANRVYAAVMGHPYGPNLERGVFRSVDGGEQWEKVLFKDQDTGAIELAFDPKNARTIYADLWSARLGPWENGAFSGPGSGLFKSTDGGTTWRPLTQGLPAFAQGLGRIGLGVAPSDGKRIYAMVDASPTLGGLYRSDDAGMSWGKVNGETRVWGRGSDFAGVKVDPVNRDLVYVANTSTYRSTDGGVTFIAIKGAPGGDDYHTIWINPDNPRNIMLGADQGATITVNGGETWSSWYNQSTAQFYHVATDNRFPYWVYGGQQESGSAGVASRSDYGEISFRDWHPVGVEEYGYVAPDPLHAGVLYGGKVTRFDEATGNVQQVGPSVLKGKYRLLRTAPLLFSSVNPHALYLGAQMVLKTLNGGHSWQEISPDLSRASWEVPANVGVFAAQNKERGNRRGVVYTIAPSYRDASVIWAGTDDGLIHLTRDAGAHWHDVTPPGLTAWSKVSLIDAGRFDSSTAYAAINRIRLDDLKPHLFRTHDSGKTWTEVVNGLPVNAPVNAVREDPFRKGLLYAATELGVFVSFDDGDHWQALMSGLPPSSVRDVVVHENDLVAGTHGRGFYILDDITPLRQMTAPAVSSDAFLFKPAVAYRVRRNQNTDTPLPPEEPAGKNPPDGATLHYYLKTATAVMLEIYDSANLLVRRYSSNDKQETLESGLNVPLYWIRPFASLSGEPGLHRFVWDLHGPPPAVEVHEYPISAIYADTPRFPLGSAALPGRYTVKLTAGGATLSQTLTLKMDPRVKTPSPGLTQQFRLATKVCAMLREDSDALKQVRALSAKSTVVNRDVETNRENLTRLNEDLSQILAVLEGSDDTPTTQAVAAVTQAEAALQVQLAQWKRIQTTQK